MIVVPMSINAFSLNEFGKLLMLIPTWIDNAPVNMFANVISDCNNIYFKAQ